MSSETKSSSSSLNEIGKLVFLFALWYGFNAGYNVYNAKLKVLAFPVTISAIQLLIGLVYAVPLWVLGIRTPPKLNFSDLIKLFPIAALNALGHSVTVVAMFQKGGGSFAHVIKASEPVVSVIMALLISGIVPKPLTAITLLPVTYGVAYASTLGNLDIATMSREFTSLVAIMAMIGNISFAFRSILRKNIDSEFKKRTNLNPVNEHAITTLYSFVLLIPFMIYFEAPETIQAALFNLPDVNGFYFNLFVCGMCFYIYNEMQNIVLGSLGPVPTAVGNTLKRVVIFVALYFFTEGETFPWPKILGCAIAIVGCLFYAICDSMKV